MMPTVSPDVILRQLNWRYACQKFDPSRKIPAEIMTVLEQSLMLAPSSLGVQPWKFIIVGDAQMKARIRAVGADQSQYTDADRVVVLAYKRALGASDVDQLVGRAAEVRAVQPSSLLGYQRALERVVADRSVDDMDVWLARQAYIPLGFLLMTAAMLEIDSCPMEGFDASAMTELLHLDRHGYEAVVTCTLGYRAADDPKIGRPKVRHRAEDVIVHI